MSEHAPMPWVVGGDDWKPWEGAISVIGADYETICWTTSGGGIPSQANAAFIVQAVNNHERLVDALLSLDTLLDFGDEEMDHVWTFEDLTSIKAAFDKARAALEHATFADLIAPRHA